MNKVCFTLLLLLLSFISCADFTGVPLVCYENCMKKIKSSAYKAQTCIVTRTLLELAKSNPLSVAKMIVKTVTGAQTAFEKCQGYIDDMNSYREQLSTECCDKCRNRGY